MMLANLSDVSPAPAIKRALSFPHVANQGAGAWTKKKPDVVAFRHRARRRATVAEAAVGPDETQPRQHRERRQRVNDGVNWVNPDHDIQMQMIGLRLKPIEEDVSEIKGAIQYVHKRIDDLLRALGTSSHASTSDDRGMSTQTMVYRTAELISRKPLVGLLLAGLVMATVGGIVFGLLAWKALE